MKKLTLIAVSLLMLNACTPSGGGSGSSATPTSSFTISVNGGTHSTSKVAITPYVERHGGNITNITVRDYDLSNTLVGDFKLNLDNGTYKFYTAGAAGSGMQVGDQAYNSDPNFVAANGTVTITHDGTDYLQGTYIITLDNNATHVSYPCTGSFKIYQ